MQHVFAYIEIWHPQKTKDKKKRKIPLLTEQGLSKEMCVCVWHTKLSCELGSTIKLVHINSLCISWPAEIVSMHYFGFAIGKMGKLA